jgi:uracil-DNA glycosylase family 4
MPELRYIRGEGPLHAKLMVVGEAPGFFEEQEGRPFVGPSGRLLNKFLRDAGIDRSEVYVTNVVKVRPPNNKFERLREYRISPTDFLPELKSEIQAVGPNCILALGKNALKFLTGRSGKGDSITENRGSILTLQSSFHHQCKVIATFHPANLLHMEGGEFEDVRTKLWMASDFQKAVEESKFPELNLPNRVLTVARNSHDVWRYVQRFQDKPRASVDVEVKKSIPVVLGLAYDPFDAIAVPLLDFQSQYNDGGEHLCSSPRDVADSVHTIFTSIKDKDIVGQNFKFDHDKLEPRGAVLHGRIIDVMLLHATLYPEFPKSLEFMASIHTREPYWKNETMYKTSLKNLALGCARDAAVTLELAELLLPQLTEFGLYEFFFGFSESDWRYPFCIEKLHNLYRSIDHVGFAFDPKINKELVQKYKSLIAGEQAILNEMVGGSVNVNSNPQVAYLIYEHLKLPKRGKGGAGTGEDILVALMNSPSVRNDEHKTILASILKIRRLRRVVSGYLKTELDFDGRMRTYYKIVGTETGRTSTAKPGPPEKPYPMGLAFQTLTKHGDIGPDIRKQFIVDPGYVFIQADSRQAEARVVFLLAENYEGLVKMDDPDYDIHAHTASWFNPEFTVEHLKKDKLRRFTGKKIRHAGNYDMEKRRCMLEYNNDAKKFGLDSSISEWKANELLKIFHDNDPSIRGNFHAQIRETLDECRTLVSPFGRRREFFGDPDDHGFYKEGFAQIPQATVADNTKRAMLLCKDEDPNLRIVLEWHDGFLALVPEREAESYARLFIRTMELPIDFSECSLKRGILRIPCELEYSDTNFYDLKPFSVERESELDRLNPA